VIDAPDAVEVPARETGNTSTRRPQ
jgi:hypothetical protein